MLMSASLPDNVRCARKPKAAGRRPARRRESPKNKAPPRLPPRNRSSLRARPSARRSLARPCFDNAHPSLILILSLILSPPLFLCPMPDPVRAAGHRWLAVRGRDGDISPTQPSRATTHRATVPNQVWSWDMTYYIDSIESMPLTRDMVDSLTTAGNLLEHLPRG
jgi:hypothetical protein